MNATTSILRRGALASSRRLAGQPRYASTLMSGWTRHATSQSMTPFEKFTTFCPTEAYPLIVFATGMCSYGLVTGYKALKKGSDIEELRMMPKRWGETQCKEVWED